MQTGKTALEQDIAQELGVSDEELSEWQSQLKITNVVSLNEFMEQGSEPVMDAKNNSHFIQPEERVQEGDQQDLKRVRIKGIAAAYKGACKNAKKPWKLYEHIGQTLKRR